MAETKKEASTQETRTVSLPEQVASRVDDRLPRTEFDSAGEYVTFVVQEVLYRVENDTDEEAFGEDEQVEVEERLESLGYLDE